MQAFTGLVSLTGHPDQQGVKAGFPVSDVLAAYVAYGSIMAAIIERLKSGKGQFIETSLFAALMHSLVNVSSLATNGFKVGKRVGNKHHQICPYGVFKTKDEIDIMVAPNTDSIFRKIAKIIDYDIPPHLATNPQRVKAKQEFQPQFEAQFNKFTSDYLIQEFEKADVPYSLINTLNECVNHPHTQASGIIQRGEDGFNHIAHPASFSRLEIRAPSKCPELGEHTEQILREVLKYDEGKIERIIQNQKKVPSKVKKDKK